MRELAVRAVGLAPLLEQGQDPLGFLRQQPVHRGTARCPVGELASGPAGDPAMGPDLAELEQAAGASDRPTGLDRFIDQVQQAGLGGRIDTAWDAATQPQPPFSSTNVNRTASSLHASESRATSALACSSS